MRSARRWMFWRIVLTALLAGLTAQASYVPQDRTMQFQLIDSIELLTTPDGDPLPSPVPRNLAFRLKYHFKIGNTEELFPGDTYYLQIPAELPVTPIGPFNLPQGSTDPLATWKVITGNRIQITFADAIDTLSSREGWFWLEMGFDSSAIGDGGLTDLVFDMGFGVDDTKQIDFATPASALIEATKSGTYLPASNEIAWEIKLDPKGTNFDKIIIRDMIPEHTELVPGSFTYDRGPIHPGVMTAVVEGRLITITLPSKISSTKYVGYRTKVLDSAFEGLPANQVKLIENEAIVGWSDGSVHTNTAQVPVSVVYVNKSAVHNSTNKRISWTVVVNPQGFDMQNVSFKDTLPAGLTYIDGSLQIVREDNSLTPVAGASFSGGVLTAGLGNLSAPMKLVYETSVADSFYAGGNHALTNKVEIGQDGGTPGKTEGSATVNISGASGLSKVGSIYQSNLLYPPGYSPSDGVITWTVEFNKSSITMLNPTITDTVVEPTKHTYVTDSLQIISELPAGVTYGVTSQSAGGVSFKINGTITGPVKFQLKTKLVDPNIYQNNYVTGNFSTATWPKNTVRVTADGYDQTAEAVAYLRSIVLQKAADSAGFNHETRSIRYLLTVNRNGNTLQNVVVTDKLKRPLVFKPDSLKIVGSSDPVTYTYTETPDDTTYSGVLNIELGDISSTVALELIAEIDINDPAALALLKLPGDKSLVNEATLTHAALTKDPPVVKTDTKILTSVVQKSGNAPDNGAFIDWRVVINKAQLEMNGFVLSDQLVTGLELETVSLKLYKATVSSGGVVTTGDEVIIDGSNISYNPETGLFTFSFPESSMVPNNSTYVLTFRTLVVIEQQGNYSNSVVLTFDGQSATSAPATVKTYWIGAGGDAWGELGSLSLLKTEEHKPAQPIAGARFELYDRYNIKVAELTTDENGLLNYDRLRFDIPYTLKETEAPTGYLLGPETQTKITFTIDGTAPAHSIELTMENSRKGGYRDITATKLWEDWPEDVELPSVYFRLMWHLEGQDAATASWVPDTMLSEGETAVQQPALNPLSGKLEASWSNMPVQDLNGVNYVYIVREVDDEGELMTPTDAEHHYTKLEAGLSVTNTGAHTNVTFSKTVVNGTEELEGATLQVFEGEDDTGTKVDEWVSTGAAKTISLVAGVYTMVEKTAPEGYEIAEQITFRVNLDGSVDIKQGTEWVSAAAATVRMQDALKPQGVTFSKTVVNGTEELAGATLQVFEGEDDTGTKVDEWVSTGTAKTISLVAGVYTMVEKTAPEGYEIAEQITFRVNLDGSVDIRQGTEWVPAAAATVRMQDALKPRDVTFSKTVVNGTDELEGATLQVFEGENDSGTKIDEWVSTGMAKSISLVAGVYTMVEKTAPEGYEIAEQITFRVNLDGSVDIKQGAEWVPAAAATVRMQDALKPRGVTFSKTVVNGTEELEGATLQVFEGEDDTGTKVDEWLSTDTAKTISLVAGVYTMVEKTAPEGYEIAEQITFRVNLDGSVDIKQGTEWVPAAAATVRMEDAYTPHNIAFSKTAVNGTRELPGAKLQVFAGESAATGVLQEAWTSTSEQKTIQLIPGIYTMVETTAPIGYQLAESIVFRVNLDGSVDIQQGSGWVKAQSAVVRMQDAKIPAPEPEPEPEPSYGTLHVPLHAKKTLRNGRLQAGAYSFLLKDAAGHVLAEVSNDEQGNIYFPDRTFSRVVSNYLYTIEERAGTQADIDYDRSVYTVLVSTKAVGGELEASVEVLKNSTPYAGEMQFTNTRKPPATGDNRATIIIGLALAALVVGGAGLVIHRRRRKDRTED